METTLIRIYKEDVKKLNEILLKKMFEKKTRLSYGEILHEIIDEYYRKKVVGGK